MKISLAISTALLALGPASGGRRTGKPVTTKYKLTEKTMWVEIYGDKHYNDCSHQHFDIWAFDKIQKTNENGSPTLTSLGRVALTLFDSCEGTSSLREYWTEIPKLTGGLRRAELNIEGLAYGSDCDRGDFCVPVSNVPFSIRAVLTATSTPTTIRNVQRIVDGDVGTRTLIKVASGTSSHAELDLSGSEMGGVALPATLDHYDWDKPTISKIKSGTIMFTQPSEA
jgi:hypothetical protein